MNFHSSANVANRRGIDLWTRTLVFGLLLLAFAAVIGGAGCSKAAPTASLAKPHDKPVVLTVNYPLYYFAQRLGGDAFAVEFPMKGAGDPAFWEPDVATIIAYQKADLILLNGAGFGAWTQKVSLPERKTVDCGAAFSHELLNSGESITHSHGLQGAHTHPAIAFTTWIDPRLAMLQADAIAAALTTLKPAEGLVIATRLAALKTDWANWNREFEAVVAPHRDRPVIASHPVYQYLIRAGGLNWRAVHWEPDETPSVEQWEAFAKLAKEQPPRWMVWESEPLPAVRERLKKDFGIECVVFDPTSNRPAKGDLLSAMHANLDELRKVYGSER